MRALRRTAATAIAATLACGGPQGPPVIGVAFQETGVEAMQVARDELSGWPIRIELAFDSALTGDPADVEVGRAQRLVAMPRLVAVVGHGSSRGTLASAPVYADAGIPQVAPTSTSRLLASAGPWTFSLAPSDSIEGRFMADFAVGSLGARTVTIYFLNDEYGEGLRDGVRARLREQGVAVLDEVSVDPRSDFATLVEASLRRGVPDVVVVAARWVETAGVAHQMAGRHPEVRVVAGDGAVRMPILRELLGDAARNVYVVAFWLPDGADSVGRAYAERFRRITGAEPTGTHAMTHDAIMVVATAIREVGPRPERIRRYLASLGRERPPYAAVTGPVSFGRDRPGSVVMTRVSGDRLVRAVTP